MQRIRIQRRAPLRGDRGWDAVLPLDPRDPDVVRAKLSPPRGETDPSRRIGRRA